MWLIDKIKHVDPTINSQKIVLLDFEAATDIANMACTWIIVETLSFVWAIRRQKKRTEMTDLKAILFTKAQFLGTTISFKNTSKTILAMLK